MTSNEDIQKQLTEVTETLNRIYNNFDHLIEHLQDGIEKCVECFERIEAIEKSYQPRSDL